MSPHIPDRALTAPVDPTDDESPRVRLRRAWVRLGQPSTLSLRVAIFYLPVGAAGPLLLDRPRFGGSLATWLAVTLAAQAVLTLALVASGRVVHRGGTASRPVATLLAIFISVLLRGMVLVLSANEVSRGAPSEYRYRVVGALFVQAAFLVVIAQALNAWREHAALMADLEERRARLIDLDGSMADRLEWMQAELVQRVRSTIVPRITEVTVALDAVAHGLDKAASIARLTALVENEVRPLSQRLSAGEEMYPDVQSGPVQSAVHRRAVPDRMLVGSAVLPWLGGFLIFGGALTAAVRYLEPLSGLLFILAMSATMVLGLLVARLLLSGWLARTPIVALVAIPIPAIIAFATVEALARTHVVPVAGLQYSAVWLGVIIGAASFGYQAVSVGRAATEQELRETVEQLQRSISLLRQNCWVIQRRLGYVMHGSVQGALHAAAMRLSESGPPDPALIATIHTDINGALARLDLDSVAMVSVQDSLRDIASLWEGECEISWFVTEGADAAIVRSRTLAECVVEIAREAVSNAIRHGRAQEISVDMSLAEGFLVVCSSDDGTSTAPAGPPGLGSRMLDETCVRWVRKRIDGSTVLTAWLALPDSQDLVRTRGA